MKIDLADVLRDGPLTTLALAIALGWSLFQTGQGVAWVVGGRELTFDQLVMGVLELATALAVAQAGPHQASPGPMFTDTPGRPLLRVGPQAT